MGVTLGVVVAACAVAGRTRAGRIVEVAVAGGAVVLCACVCSLAGGLVAHLGMKNGWAVLPESIVRQVGHVYRVGFSYGLECGAVFGGVAGAVLAGAHMLWRRGLGHDNENET